MGIVVPVRWNARSPDDDQDVHAKPYQFSR